MAYTTIKKPSDYFNTVTYTGNTSSGTTINSLDFAPNMVWFKSRTQAENHQIYDSVRGVTKRIIPNGNQAEATASTGLTSFNSDGFTTGGENETDSGNIVAWNWKANGAGVANTDGTISSTVSVNATSGFSIVKWTGNGSAGATIGHGLGSAPSTIFVKKISDVGDWSSYHSALGNTGYMRLNNTNAFATASTYWNNTSPDSSVFTLGTTGNVNGSGASYIAYCFAEKQGYSKFGSYTGNGNVDGTFVYTGFKPAWLLIKETTQTRNWVLYDNKRVGYNPNQYEFLPDTSNTEDTTTTKVDLLSNGFKIKASHATVNENAQTYIYMAFAEEPLIGDNPATAR